MNELTIRTARAEDVDCLVEFQKAMAAVKVTIGGCGG